uniref:PDZ domain-containing protein n=1 Tax=Globodera rostochiensis TaxID=31243 RepID=A0A914HBT7_GLORO
MLAAHSSPKPDYITVLAIYDDPPSKHRTNCSDGQPTSKLSIPISGSSEFIGKGGHSANNGNVQRTEIGASLYPKESFAPSFDVSNKSTSILRNSNKKNLQNDCHSVHFEGKSQSDVNRLVNSYNCIEKWNGNSRKSRIANSFLDAKESIEHELNEKWPDFDRTLYQLQRIVLSADTKELSLGLEVSPVPNLSSPSRLLAVEVRSIEENGRIADDGRLRVGDQLVEINEMPCEMASFARVQLRLRELQSFTNPSFAFFRRIPQIKPSDNQQNPQRVLPVTTALQMGNTSQIGETKIVRLKKGEEGFGFTYAGRESFANDRREFLFYVKAIRKECGGMAIGDRILQVDKMSLAGMSQSEVTSLLKGKLLGDVIELLISRNVVDSEHQMEGKSEKEANIGRPTDQILDSLNAHFLSKPDMELHCLDIPLNDTPGAGLGLSLKAQRVGTIDSGLYIRSILHGSAAFKDGRLQVNDRLVGIEDQNLLNYELNGEALEAFMRTISQMPQMKQSIRLFVVRKMQLLRDLNSKPFGGGARRGSDSDLSQLSNFDREAPSRRSISEKRSLVAHRDPSHLRTYQKIVHQRQISAPALSSTAVSNSTRSRRSLYDEFRRVRSSQVGPNGKRQRPKTMFYVDEAGVSLDANSGFSSTFPPNTVRVTNNKNNNHIDSLIASRSAMCDSENEAIPSSTSYPSSLSEFAKGVAKNKNPCTHCQDQSELKQTKSRRGSLGNGLFKLFGRGSTHKEKDGGKERPHRPPPPPYHRLPPMANHPHHQPPCQCSSIEQYCPQQCSHIYSGPTANFDHLHRTNNCTRLHHFYRSSLHPTPARSFGTSITDRRQFRSAHFGPVEVPHSQDDTNTLCREQQWPSHIQNIRHSRRQNPATKPSQLAWTTIIHSIPGSLPERVPRDFSDGSDEMHRQNHRSLPLEQSLLPSPETVTKRKSKSSAVFYDQCSDWVIRC